MRRSACVVAVSLCLTATAAADAKPHRKSHEEREARLHFAKGVELEGQGEFEMAMLEFSTAQTLAPDPANTLHLGECQEALGKIVAAISIYQRYLSDVGDAPGAAAIRRHVADLKIALHADAAKRLLDDKEYEKALHEIEEAEKVKHEPRRLYEMALCFEGMGESARAVESYQSYLKESPEAADAGEVQGRVKVLSGQRMEPPPRAQDGFALPPPSSPWYRSRPGWAVALGGAALGVGAGTLFGLSSAAGGDADQARSEADFTSANDRGRRFYSVGVALAVVAAVAVVLAVVLFVRHSRGAPSPSLTAPVAAPPSAAALP